MCTVTYWPTGLNSFNLCVNRDELPLRAKAIPPRVRKVNGTDICTPTDPEAGGTWVGISSHKRLVVLLNGAFKPHQRKLPYRKSRGLITLEFLSSPDFSETASNANFDSIEPFTLLCIEWQTELRFTVLRWDGQQRFIQFLSPVTPQLVCSAPLYDHKQSRARQSTFRQWYTNEHLVSIKGQLALHKLSDTKFPAGFYMDRKFVKSVSLTGIEKNNDHCAVYYEDLEHGEVHETVFHV